MILNGEIKTPALKAAGWELLPTPEFADYVLMCGTGGSRSRASSSLEHFASALALT